MDALGNEVMSRDKDDLTRLLRLMDAVRDVIQKLKGYPPANPYEAADYLERAVQS